MFYFWSAIAFAGSLGCLKATTQIPDEQGRNYQFSKETAAFTGLLAMALTLVPYLFGDFIIPIAYWTPFTWFLSVQFMVDVFYHELADEWNGVLGALSLMCLFLFFPVGVWWSHAIATFLIFSLFFGVWWTTNSLGFGDVKFLAATGWLLPLEGVLPFLFVASLSGSVYGLVKVTTMGNPFKKENRNLELAFGPHLILGLVAALQFL